MIVESIGDALRTVYAQHSGLLQAACMQAGRTVEGELYLLSGQPIYARTGEVSGQKALEHMLTWRIVDISFRPDAFRPPANLSSRIDITSPVAAYHSLLMDHPSTSIMPDKHNQKEREERIPRKIGSEPSTRSWSLTRRQRWVYFLVDGQRTVLDLSRCSGKTTDEVESLLQDLYQMGLIDFST